MDKVMWVVIAAAVVIAFAGMLLYIGGEGLGDFDDKKNETANQLCSFEASEVEAGRLECSDISERCQGEISQCR